MGLTWLQRWSWYGLLRFSGFQERLRHRFTPAGRGLLGATAAAAVIGLDTRQTLAHQAFALGLALLLLAWLGSLRRPPPVQAGRHLPRHATVGDPVHYNVELHYRGRRTARDLELSEQPPDPRPDLTTFLLTRAPGEMQVNPLDRVFAYPRWRWLVQRGSWFARQPAVALPALENRGPFQVALSLTPRRRGVLRLPALRLARRDPLGLRLCTRTVGQPQTLVVLPRRYPVPPQRPAGRRRLQPGGVTLASSVGDAREYLGLRDYRPGDSPRHIHWAAWARTGAPLVKEYQDEYFSRQALILDSFAAPGEAKDFEAAVSVAASFVEPLHGPDALLDLMFVADRAYTVTSGRGVLSSQSVLELLACLEPTRKGGFDELSRAVLGHAPVLSACVCVLMAWDAPRQALVAGLLALNLPVRVLLVSPSRPKAPGPLAGHPENLHHLHPDRLAEGLAGL